MEKSLWYHYSGNPSLVLVPRQEVRIKKDPCAKEDPIYATISDQRKRKKMKKKIFKSKTKTKYWAPKKNQNNQDWNERDADKVALNPILEAEGGYYFLFFPL
jgi:hypothetical protein